MPHAKIHGDISKIHENIEYLNIGEGLSGDLAGLRSKALKHFETGSWTGRIVGELQNLPQNLEVLRVRANSNCLAHVQGDFSDLPYGLQVFDAMSLSVAGSLNGLPPSLKIANLCVDHVSGELSDLPPGIKDIGFHASRDGYCGITGDVNDLRQSLTTVHMRECYWVTGSRSALPRSVDLDSLDMLSQEAREKNKPRGFLEKAGAGLGAVGTGLKGAAASSAAGIGHGIGHGIGQAVNGIAWFLKPVDDCGNFCG